MPRDSCALLCNYAPWARGVELLIPCIFVTMFRYLVLEGYLTRVVGPPHVELGPSM
ncbi:hypothetical protein M413DRAFT_443926 [Hebeloma cylindrosporum]|uniref:Uncharacterized protein n=1 Tax=Hebeloma cylindrosporum TaxID=76867 RepID=A0A0C3CG40_HEBCY|nr:hypothetical protein M413DRAFT_443926 [Hebeloma cylindrosporum h7]